jgi:uncharacterized repeat protein (TIGR03803 family)
MKSIPFSQPLLAALAITFSLAVRAQAQTFTVLAEFNSANGILIQTEPFIQGSNGNLYGVAVRSWAGVGTAFSMAPTGKITDIYSFCLTDCKDGAYPDNIVLGSDGNFYGTTSGGGNNGGGVAFKLTPGGKYTTLYSFCAPSSSTCREGDSPNGVVQKSDGDFYGTTGHGGFYGGGTVFDLTSSGTYKVLYNFCKLTNCNDGLQPFVPPIQASDGNLYGTTWTGGTQNKGVVYEITPGGSYKVVYNFCSQANCTDGENPTYLVQDASGNFYGTAHTGGASYGTIFKITPTNQFTVLHTFEYSDGAYPSGLIIADDGNLYGTTADGNGGKIFQITSAGVYTVLYPFCSGTSCTGTSPNGLFQRTDGIFYGSTMYGGVDYGEAYSYSTGLSPLVQTVPIAAKVGKRVIILGNGLTGSTSVTFNGTSATFTVVSDTEITATVPTGAATGTVTVTTPTKTLDSNPAFQVLK